MAREPAERYATARELADDLRRFLEVKPIKARRPSVWDRALKLGRRHAGLVAAALLVLLLAIGGLAVSLILIGRERDATRVALSCAIEQEKLARRHADEAQAQTRRAESNHRWFIQGLTEPLKMMANPDLARNPDYVAMRREVIAEAIRAYQGALQTQDEQTENRDGAIATWIHIALLYTVADEHVRAQDAYRQAIELAERLLEEAPSSVHWAHVGQTHSHLAMELWDVGRAAESRPHFRRAIAAFREAVEQEPPNIAILQSSAWFLSLFQDPRFRDPARALEQARRLVALTSEREHNRRSFSSGIRPLVTLGLAEYRMGNLDAARTALERSAELRDGGDAYEWFVLAMVAARRGHLESARNLSVKATRWMKTNRYSDFELHALDAEVAVLLGSLAKSIDRTDGLPSPTAEAGVPAPRP